MIPTETAIAHKSPNRLRQEFYAAFQANAHLRGLPKAPQHGLSIIREGEEIITAIVLSEQTISNSSPTAAAQNFNSKTMVLAVYAAAASQVTQNQALRPALALHIFNNHHNTPFEQHRLNAVMKQPATQLWVQQTRNTIQTELEHRLVRAHTL
jgi:hypothetical protein